MDLFYTHISKQSIKNCIHTLKSGFLNQGPVVAKIEKKFEDMGILNPLSVNSCTSALHLALILSETENKEVILPAQTFVATGLSILMANAIPVFCDIELNGNINLEAAEKLISSKTKALIIVHWAGNPVSIEKLKKFKRKYPHIKIIEDAAHAFGAFYDNQIVGSFSDFTCFSFQSIKSLTCGDGGLLACRSKKDYLKCRRLRWFGIDRNTLKKNKDGSRKFNIKELGYKYHMNDLDASILDGNLIDINNRINKRKNNWNYLFNNIKNPKLKFIIHNKGSSYWLCGILCKNNKDAFIKYLNKNGVPASSVDKSIHKNYIFKHYKKNKLINQKIFDKQQLNLPVHENLTKKDLDLIIKLCNNW